MLQECSFAKLSIKTNENEQISIYSFYILNYSL